MAKIRTTVTQTAEKKFKYRFTCESCGCESDWIESKITAAANSTYKGSVSSADVRVQSNTSLNARAFDNLSAAVRDVGERLTNGKLIGGAFAKYKCAKCGKKQSWSGSCSNNWITVTLTILFLCAGLGFATLTVINNPSANIIAVCAPVFLSLIPIIFIAVIATRHAEKRRREEMRRNAGSLEIDWLDGKLPAVY